MQVAMPLGVTVARVDPLRQIRRQGRAVTRVHQRRADRDRRDRLGDRTALPLAFGRATPPEALWSRNERVDAGRIRIADHRADRRRRRRLPGVIV